jgi:hypothetical protein
VRTTRKAVEDKTPHLTVTWNASPSSPIWSELADPFVGPAIRAETGTTYLTTVACATAVATALVLGGAFSASRRARNALR